MIHCCFLIGKTRVAPLKICSIPRLELTAAVLTVQLDQLVRWELFLEKCESFFCTDSTAVLQTLRNTSKRFPVFVANRLSKIENGSNVLQWRYVPTRLNPADSTSRGTSVKKLMRSRTWLTGSDFLCSGEDCWPASPIPLIDINPFLDVKRSETVRVIVSEGATKWLVKRYSFLHALTKATAWMFRQGVLVAQGEKLRPGLRLYNCSLTVAELQHAKIQLIRYVQRSTFPSLFSQLSRGRDFCSGKFAMNKLSPFLDDGVLRVGGRPSKASICYDVKHPIILPNNHHFTDLMIVQNHHQVGHSGMGHIWTSLRQKFRIIKGGAAW